MFHAYVFVTCAIRDDWTDVVAGHAFNDLLLLGIICTTKHYAWPQNSIMNGRYAKD